MSFTRTPLYKWNNKVILIAEDDLYSYHLLYEMLKNTNCDIIHTLDGASAFVSCIRSSRIDLVLLDIKLPRLNGFETARLIKKHRPEIPIIAQTAHAMVPDREKCLKCGCSEYFSKPFNIPVFMATLDGYLGKSGKDRIAPEFLIR